MIGNRELRASIGVAIAGLVWFNTYLSAQYKNHYSALLNKCFFLLIHAVHAKLLDERGKELVSFTTMKLFDLNDNKQAFSRWYRRIRIGLRYR